MNTYSVHANDTTQFIKHSIFDSCTNFCFIGCPSLHNLYTIFCLILPGFPNISNRLKCLCIVTLNNIDELGERKDRNEKKKENKLRLWNCVITSLFIAFDCSMRQKSSNLLKRHCVVRWPFSCWCCFSKKINIFYIDCLLQQTWTEDELFEWLKCSNFSSFRTQHFAENNILTTSSTISDG